MKIIIRKNIGWRLTFVGYFRLCKALQLRNLFGFSICFDSSVTDES